MSDKADAWMPLWIGAYLGDTMRLTTAQHGAYLLLLMAYWREHGPLPDDDDELRSITKTERAEWKKMRPVIEKFFRVDGSKWHHKRVEAELAGAADRKLKATAKAEKAAGARWNKQSSNAPSMPQALHEHVHDECPTPSPTPSSLRSESLTTLRVVVPDAEKPASEDPPSEAVERTSGPPDCPALSIVAAYHEILPELPRIERLTDSRRQNIRQRWREWWAEKRWQTAEEGIEEWRNFFAYVRKSAFLMGRAKSREPGRPPFIADLEWLMLPKNHVKVFEGKYHEAA